MTLLINPFLFQERLKNAISTILKCRPKLEGIVVCVMQNAGVIKFISFVLPKCDMANLLREISDDLIPLAEYFSANAQEHPAAKRFR